MLPEQFIFLGTFLNLIGQFLYIKSIRKGNAKPNLVSWLIWAMAPSLGVFFQLKAGAGLSILPIFMSVFGSVGIIFVALITKNAVWKITLFDIICGMFSLVALLLYILSHNLSISILFAILSDFLAFIPTFTKSWKHPESESSSGYSWCIANNIIGLLIIKNWSFTIYSFGLYFVLANTAEMIILYRKKIFKFRSINSILK